MKNPAFLRKMLDNWFWWRHIPRYRLDVTAWFEGWPSIVHFKNETGGIQRIWEGASKHRFDLWCEENMPSRWRAGWDTARSEYVVLFKHEEDMIHFKLYWSEQLAEARRAKPA